MAPLELVLAAFVVGAGPNRSPENLLLDGLSVLLIVLPIWDWRVAWKLGRAAYQRPRYEALTASAVSAVVTAIAATLAGLLGTNRIQSVLMNAPGFLPPWLALAMLAATLVLISIPNLYKDRLFNRLEHRLERPNRRWNDPTRRREDRKD